MAPLFGFVQFDFPGALPLPDGRYLARDGGRGAEGAGGESVLVVQTLGAPAPPPRRRRRPRRLDSAPPPPELPLARVTVVDATPFAAPEEAAAWLERACEDEAAEQRAAAALTLLNRALHAQAVASADPAPRTLTAAQAAAVRIGYAAGEEAAAGRFAAAREVDVRGRPASRRRRREEELRPQARVAAVLAGRERLDACETLLLRARADLDSGRDREAALQLRAALDALLVELAGALSDPDHEQDMATLRGRRAAVEAAARQAPAGELGGDAREEVAASLALAERILRRRRVLEG